MTVPAALADPLLTAEEVAKFLRVSLSMVYKLRREGKLPAVPVGALYRFHPDVLRAYARGEVGAGATVHPLKPRRRT